MNIYYDYLDILLVLIIVDIMSCIHINSYVYYQLVPSLLEGPSPGRHQLEFEHPSQGAHRPSDPAEHV